MNPLDSDTWFMLFVGIAEISAAVDRKYTY
jgi:hypothetical protein